MTGGMTFERWCENLGRASRLSRSFAALRAAIQGHVGTVRLSGAPAGGPVRLAETVAERSRKKPRNNLMQRGVQRGPAEPDGAWRRSQKTAKQPHAKAAAGRRHLVREKSVE
jgi:hypothetical protein